MITNHWQIGTIETSTFPSNKKINAMLQLKFFLILKTTREQLLPWFWGLLDNIMGYK